mmetsp:Transcript_3969/g.5802  ORF Transcript_3969/g.5802 Transcript_3969/m.5802 type:complete len:171 (-) Transcript_3969:190-702(-)
MIKKRTLFAVEVTGSFLPVEASHFWGDAGDVDCGMRFPYSRTGKVHADALFPREPALFWGSLPSLHPSKGRRSGGKWGGGDPPRGLGLPRRPRSRQASPGGRGGKAPPLPPFVVGQLPSPWASGRQFPAGRREGRSLRQGHREGWLASEKRPAFGSWGCEESLGGTCRIG